MHRSIRPTDSSLAEACRNLGIYLSLASTDSDGIDLILELLKKSQNLDDKASANIIWGWLTTYHSNPQSEDDVWVEFGIVVAELLGLDDGSHYDRTNYQEGEFYAEGQKAIEFITSIPETHRNNFLIGMGLGGFQTEEEDDNNKTI